jgi:hypothetical protein
MESLRIGPDEFFRLTPESRSALQGWITSFFPCNPDHIEWIEFTADPSVTNWSMLINLIAVVPDSERPTLLSELHSARITTIVPDGLLIRLYEVTEKP